MPLILEKKSMDRLRRAQRLKRLKMTPPKTRGERELLNQMNKLWEKVLFPATERIKQMVAAGAPAYEIADLIEKVLDEAQTEYNIVSDDIIWRWMSTVDQITRNNMFNGLQESLGVDIQALVDTPEMQMVLQGSTIEAAGLIKSIPRDYMGEVAKAVADNYMGKPLPEGRSLLDQIQEVGKVSRNRARVIARDQTNKLVGNINQARQQSIGIETYKWRTVKDQRVVGKPGGKYPKGNEAHGNHYMMEGLLCRWDDPTKVSYDDGATWKSRKDEMPQTHPGQDIQCFLGETKIDFSNGCYELFRRIYTGKATEIITVDGRKLKATPNHPILTNRGWVAINEIQMGDYIVERISDDTFFRKGNNNNFIARFDDMFKSCDNLRIAPVIGTESNFHGDGTNNHIDTVNIERFLLNYIISALPKEISNFIFSRTKTASPGHHFLFGVNSRQHRGFSSAPNGTISRSLMRIVSKFFPFLWTRLSHPDKHTFGSISDRNIIFNKDAFYRISGNVKLSSEVFYTRSREKHFDNLLFRKIVDSIIPARNLMLNYNPSQSEITAKTVTATAQLDGHIFKEPPFLYKYCRVIDKTISELSNTHVYNLRSFNGYYIADNFIVSNCRCRPEAVIDVKKILKFAQLQ